MKIQAGRMLAGGFLLFGLGSAAAHAGGIQGTITSAATTAPIENVAVNVYNATGQYVAWDSTDALGAYSVSGLADGTYFARTNNALGYVDELYDNVACLGYCTVTNGTAIVVSGGGTATGIDFALNPGGRVSGTVTDTASAPLVNVRVEVLNSSGVALASGYSDASGAYLTDSGLPTGSYLVRTRNYSGYVDELYDNLPCVGSCTLTGAMPITVTAGATTSAINFSLSAGGRVAGTVRDASTSAPLADITVSVVDAGGTTVTSGRTDAAGSYLTQAGLPGGTYFVRTYNSVGYVNELWNNVPCPGACPLTSATPVTIAPGSTVSGIDFDLTPGGGVSGTVTSSTTSSPLANIWVRVVDARGGTVASATTDASGNYVTQEGLPTGSYFAHTSNSQGYVDQTHAGLVCAGSCSLASATPISVTAGAVTPGVNFALSPGGRVSGRVRDASTLLPLASVQVWIVSATGSFLVSGTTDGSGYYVTQAGLPAGSYYARTYRAAGYIDELYNNLPCVGTCNVTAGTGIVVSPGSTTSGVDFDLQAGGRVSGTVTNAVSGTPLAGVWVSVLSAAGSTLTDGRTDTLGHYLSGGGLPAGSYFLRTDNTQGYLNERYDNVACSGSTCPTTGGTPVAVGLGATTSGIDFGLVPGGRVAGQVVDAVTFAPLAGVTVSVVDQTWGTTSRGITDSLGNYVTEAGLPTGSFYAQTSNSSGYVNELYDNVLCAFGCSTAGGTAIPVALGSTGLGVDFGLSFGGRVTGTIRDAATAIPLANVSVQVLDAAGSMVGSANSNSLGQYTVAGLATGTYYARTSNSAGYLNQLHSGVPCTPSCNPTSGTPMTVSLGGTVAGVDFNLNRGGRVAGTVTDAATSLPLNGVTVSVISAAGLTVASGRTDLGGHYVSGAGLLPGNYFVRTANGQGYVNEVYDNIPCVGSCVVTLGTAVSVGAGATTSGIDLALSTGGRVSGVVTDATTGAPVPDVTVSISDASGRSVTSGSTDAFGHYLTGSGLPPGTYFARTYSALGYVDELYGGAPCLGCSVTTGTPFTVSSGTTSGIDFALQAGGRLAGRVIDATSGLPVSSASIRIFDATGREVAYGYTEISGYYRSESGLPPGTYYAATANSQGYVNELFGGAVCVGNCLVTAGTPIVLSGPGVVSGIDFELSLGGRVSGTVLGTSLTPIASVSVLIYDATGRFVTSGTSDSSGAYLSRDGLTSGTYFARTSNSQGLVNRLYNAIDCLSCDPISGTPISVTLGAVTPAISFTLAAGGRVTGTVTHALTSVPLPNIRVAILNAAGTTVASGTSDGLGQYLSREGVPTGTYFVRTENALGYVNEFWNNHPCVLTCSVSDGDGIALTAGATNSGIGFALTPDSDAGDGDGIAATVDKDAVTGADESTTYSDDFNDVPLSGSTSGTIVSRGGWTLAVGDVSPGGVQARLAGSGSTPATVETCAAGGIEQLTLDVAGETATVLCDPTTGSTTARAVVATPLIELRDPPSGPGAVVYLSTGQAATMGSPVTADLDNTESVQVALVDAGNLAFGSFALDPGDSVDVTFSPAGTVDTAVLAGTVTITVGAQTVTLNPGQSHTWSFATPDQILAGLAAQVDSLRASGDIRSRGVARFIKQCLALARWLIVQGHEAAAKHLLRGLIFDLEFFAHWGLITGTARDTLVPPLRGVIAGLP